MSSSISASHLGYCVASAIVTAILTFLACGMFGLTWRLLRARRGLPPPPRFLAAATGAMILASFTGNLVHPLGWRPIESVLDRSFLLIACLLLLPALLARLAPAGMLELELSRASFTRRRLIALGALAAVAILAATASIVHGVSVQRSLDREIAAADAELAPFSGLLDRNAILQARKAYLNALIEHVVAIEQGHVPAEPPPLPSELRAIPQAFTSPTWNPLGQGRAIAARRAALDERMADLTRAQNLQRHAAELEREIDNLDEQIAQVGTIVPGLHAPSAAGP